MRKHKDMFDLESYCIVQDLESDSEGGEIELNVRPYIQRFALNTTLTLCYGTRMDNVYDDTSECPHQRSRQILHRKRDELAEEDIHRG